MPIAKKRVRKSRVKEWFTVHVEKYLDTGNLSNEIQRELNELAESGWEPAFVTYVGPDRGSNVIISAWRYKK